MFVIDIIEPMLPADKAPAFREAHFSAFEVMHDVWEALSVAHQHSSRSYLSFMGKAVALDAERYWLADHHAGLLAELAPFDLREG